MAPCERSFGRFILGFVAGLLIAGSAHGQLPVRYEWTGSAANQGHFMSVGCAGDFNGDGRDDVIIGTPGAGSFAGGAVVRSGLDGTILVSIGEIPANAGTGAAVSVAGDVNNDGLPDIIVGSTHTAASGFATTGPLPGSARVVSGGNGALLHVLSSGSHLARFGSAVSGAGDVNNDGFADLIVGAPTDDTVAAAGGSAHVFSGADGSLLYSYFGDANDRLGTAVSGAGDLNGDGFDDFLVGVPLDDDAGNNSGCVRAYSGSDGTLIHQINGLVPGSWFGNSADEFVDINGDGIVDFMAAGRGQFGSPNSVGYIGIFSGSDAALLLNIPTSNTTVAANAGDVDGDDIPDIVAGTPFGATAFTSWPGRVAVYSGADGSILLERSSTLGSQLGNSVSTAGDIDGDGLAEIIFSASGHDLVTPAFVSDVGQVQVLSLCGSERYGEGVDASQSLGCAWRSLGTPGARTTGELVYSGASPFSSGIVGVSSCPANFAAFGSTILVDLQAPGAFTQTFSFDATGEFRTPLDLIRPNLAGLPVYIQVAAADPATATGVASSNGLSVLFCR